MITTKMTTGLLVTLSTSAGCVVISPPPMLALHNSLMREPAGSMAATIVVGIAGGGKGVALRFERQTTDDFTIGGELSAGYGKDADGAALWLVTARGYTRFSPTAADPFAVTSGAGFSFMNTGLIAFTPHVGAAMAYQNTYAIPTLQLSAAGSFPIKTGRRFGKRWIGSPWTFYIGPDYHPSAPTPEQRKYDEQKYDDGQLPRTTWFVVVDVGLVTPIGDTKNAISINAGAAWAITKDDDDRKWPFQDLTLEFSAADRQRTGGQ